MVYGVWYELGAGAECQAFRISVIPAKYVIVEGQETIVSSSLRSYAYILYLYEWSCRSRRRIWTIQFWR